MEQENRDERRNFVGGVIHGTFLRSSSRLADIDLILPAFVSTVTGSKLLIALLPSIYFSTGRLPQVLFSRYVEPKPRKKPYLYLAILTRASVWFFLGFILMWRGVGNPNLFLALLFLLVLIYSLAGSLGGVALTDIIGKAISSENRGKFYAARQITGSLLAFGTGFLVKYILGENFSFGFPRNYATLFLLSGAALLIGVLGFYAIKEPKSEPKPKVPIGSYFSNVISIVREDRKLRSFLITRILAGFHIMIIPYYIVFFREVAGVPASFIGIYLIARIVGGALSNFLWGRKADQNSQGVIVACLGIAAVTPVSAILLTDLPPVFNSITFILAGSAINARLVGFNTQLLDLAPEDMRSTYSGIRGTTIALTAPLPFLAGGLIELVSFRFTFSLVSALMFLGLLFNVWEYRRRK